MARFKTIREMEAASKQEADDTVAIKIDDHWLSVKSLGGDDFEYEWGVNKVPRHIAKRVLARTL